MGEAPEMLYVNGFSKFVFFLKKQLSKFVLETEKTNHGNNVDDSSTWYEEVIDDDLKWSFKLNRFVILLNLL